MPFIGNQPALSYTSFAKQDFTTSATTSYTLDHSVANENEIALFINFVRQEPTTAYTASGTTLTLTSATSASDDMYCVFLGKAVQTVNPPNGSVSLDKIDSTAKSFLTRNYRNIIINGDMSIAQRGISTSGVTTTDGYYACDRWYSQTDIGTWTISQSTDVPTGQGFVNSFKMDCTSAGTSNADEVMIRSKHEGQNLQYLKYGTSSAESLTLSFWIKSNKTGNYYVAFVNNNSTQDRVVSFGYSINSANTWEKKTITIPGDTARSIENTVNEEFTIYWLFSAASTFTSGGVSNTWTNYAANRFANSDLAGLGGSTSDEVYLTGVQLEAGTSASDFEFLPYDVNLQRCQRYYQFIGGVNNATIAVGSSDSTTVSSFLINYMTTMRTSPTIAQSTLAVTDNVGYDLTVNSIAASTFSSYSGRVFFNHNATATQFRPAHLKPTATASTAGITLSAEL